jgi:redox-sensitive bicupin YhaK (pirin superfamily)
MTIQIHKNSGSHWVGNGFPVQSVFSYNDYGKEALSPFLLLDYAKPYTFSPGKEKRGVGGHPHRGFETVTIVYQGELEHRDSSGGGGKIGPGDVQWMTAARGLVHEEFHSEKFTNDGGVFEVAQLWVNLPAKDKNAAPGYQTLLSSDIPVVELAENGGSLRVIAGEYNGKKGPAKTFTPINLWDITISAGHSLELPLEISHTKTFLVLRGEITVDGEKAKAGELVILDNKEGNYKLEANTDAKLLLMSGEPLKEPVVGYGPFVMNSEAEIKKAFADFQAGKFGELSA